MTKLWNFQPRVLSSSPRATPVSLGGIEGHFPATISRAMTTSGSKVRPRPRRTFSFCQRVAPMHRLNMADGASAGVMGSDGATHHFRFAAFMMSGVKRCVITVLLICVTNAPPIRDVMGFWNLEQRVNLTKLPKEAQSWNASVVTALIIFFPHWAKQHVNTE